MVNEMREQNDTIAMGDLIFLEILQGFKSDKDYKQAKTTLQSLRQYEIFNSQMALKSTDNYHSPRKKGIIIGCSTDVIITTFCINKRSLYCSLIEIFYYF
jgi:hypothetical protein